jgi:hypothetical protein
MGLSQKAIAAGKELMPKKLLQKHCRAVTPYEFSGFSYEEIKAGSVHGIYLYVQSILFVFLFLGGAV